MSQRPVPALDESLLALTVEQVARLLQRPAQFVRDEIHAGKLKGRRLGVELRVLRRDLEAYFEACESTGPDPRRDPQRGRSRRRAEDEVARK